MKKAIPAMVIVVSIMLSACSTYTCPTYSKAPQKKAVKETRI